MKHNDLPIKSEIEDLLGIMPFAKRFADGIKDYKQDECFVVSVEGEWGIGKTSFLNLVEYELKKEDKFEILHFNPWLISNIEQLVSVFFGELIKSISHISFKTKLKTDIAKDLKAFLSVIVPDKITIGLTDGSKATWNSGKYFKQKDPHASQTLYEQKEKISEYLRNAEKRIVVIIDDIDRLMDNEVELIFRLIKGIADFDNITYILLFDRKVVSKSLAKYKAERGSKYLDKIIQYPLAIPKTSNLTIIKLLTDKLDEFLSSPGNDDFHFDEQAWSNVYSLLHRYIKNVRDVNTIFDVFSFEYASISKDVNFVDFFVITLIRLRMHELYLVIKNKPELFNYNLACATLGLSRPGNSSENQKTIIDKIKIEYPQLDEEIDLLKTIFPVFSDYMPENISKNHKRKSIADKFYFDNYFSMTVSADKLSFNIFSDYVQCLIEDKQTFRKKVQTLNNDKLSQFFEMYKAHTSDTINDDTRTNIIKNLVCAMTGWNRRDFRNDETYDDFSLNSFTWLYLVSEEITKLSSPQEAFLILKDTSIEILYRCCLRDDVEKQYKNNNNAKFDNILNKIKTIHLGEIKKIGIDELLTFQFLDQLLFCPEWQEKDISELSQQFEERLFANKNDFFNILEKFIYKPRSIPRTNHPYSISKSALKKLIDIEKVQKYVDNIETNSLTSEEQKLLKYWNNNSKE